MKFLGIWAAKCPLLEENISKTRKQEKKYKKYKNRCFDWRIRVSIPVPLACKASALPFELIPQSTHAAPNVPCLCYQSINQAIDEK